MQTGDNDLSDDEQEYLAHLSAHGPSTYGAMASALEWGATRAWRVEESLLARGITRRGERGRVKANVNAE